MSGQPLKRAREDQLKAERDNLEKEVQQLKALIAVHAPDAVLATLPPQQREFTPDLPDKVIALGALGNTEASIMAALSIKADDWNEWKVTFPPLADAASRARALALAWIDTLQQQAITRGDNRFPHQTANQYRETLRNQDGGSGAGDASKLVMVVRGASRTQHDRPSEAKA